MGGYASVSYTVEYKEAGSADDYMTMDVSSTSANISNLMADTLYQVRVMATNAKGSSAATVAFGRTAAGPTAAVAPGLVRGHSGAGHLRHRAVRVLEPARQRRRRGYQRLQRAVQDHRRHILDDPVPHGRGRGPDHHRSERRHRLPGAGSRDELRGHGRLRAGSPAAPTLRRQ